MYSYQAYGLGIHSQFKLFQFPTVVAEQDVLIRKDVIGTVAVEDETIHPYLRITPKETILSIDGVGIFLVQEGNEIIVDPSPSATQSLLLRYLVGAAIAILLYQRGRIVLHASAVSINGQGILLLGGSGAGKSSTAAAHLLRGYPFLVDDVASIDFENNEAWVYPGFPQIKLDDAAAMSIDKSTQFEYMDDLEDKKNYRINYGLRKDKVVLKHIYVLLSSDQINIERFNSQRAIIEIVRHSIPPSVVNMDKAEHLEKCLELINRVPVSGLWRPNSLNGLGEIVERVVENSRLEN